LLSFAQLCLPLLGFALLGFASLCLALLGFALLGFCNSRNIQPDKWKQNVTCLRSLMRCHNPHFISCTASDKNCNMHAWIFNYLL